MITSIPDLDIELLYYLDITSIMNLRMICKEEYIVISNLDFVQKLILVKRKYKFARMEYIINLASESGFISILEWIKKSIHEFIYNNTAIDGAAHNNHLSVLNWFDQSPYEFKYSRYVTYIASRNGNIEILEWLHKSKYEFKYGESSIDWASEVGNINVLEWFKKSKYKLIYRYALMWAKRNNHQHILSWLEKNL